MKTPIGISNRHIHLSQSDADQLFGTNYQFHTRNELSQHWQFATEETLSITWPSWTIDKIRIIIPHRPQTQIEILQSDNYILGTNAPIRLSGNLDKTPSIQITGPNWQITTQTGLIVAQRHLHISTQQAQDANFTQNQSINIQTNGPRSVIFQNVIVRIKDRYELDFHIDIDEANAAGITNSMNWIII